MKNLYIKGLVFTGLLTGASLMAAAQTTSQKIGTNPTIKNPSALLELEATDKGTLLTRVALTGGLFDATTIPNPADALTIFNTATTTTFGANNVNPGYYYWKVDAVTPANSKWVRLVDVYQDPWNVVNSSTTPASTVAQNIYHEGNVNVGISALSPTIPGLVKKFFVNGTSKALAGPFTVNASHPNKYMGIENSYVSSEGPITATNRGIVLYNTTVAPVGTPNNVLTNPISDFINVNDGNVQLYTRYNQENAGMTLTGRVVPGYFLYGRNEILTGTASPTFSSAEIEGNPGGGLTLRHLGGGNNRTTINLYAKNNKGVHFQTYAGSSGPQFNSSYVFPTTNGLPGQVLTTDGTPYGTNGSPAAILSWKDAASLIVNAIRTETSDYTVLAADETILVDATSSDKIITLPAANTAKGKKYNVKKVDASANGVNVVSAGGTIDGNAAATGVTGSLSWQGWVFQSDGINWYIISRI